MESVKAYGQRKSMPRLTSNPRISVRHVRELTCPFRGLSRRSSMSTGGKIKLAAYETLRQDDTSNTDPRMALAGEHFLMCDGIDILQSLLCSEESDVVESVAKDARRPTRALHRNAYPLAQFLSLHIANQSNRLGTAIGRRMMFGKHYPVQKPKTTLLGHGSLVVSHTSHTSQRSPGRVRASWHVSPILFRVIVAFTRKHNQPRLPRTGHHPASRVSMVGGRLLGTGRNETKVYTFDDISKEHPGMHRLCMHMYRNGNGMPPHHTGVEPICFSGRDAAHVVRMVSASAPVIPTPFLAGIAVKDILDDGDAGTELHLHQRIHRWFSEVHSIHLTCLHRELHFIELDENPVDSQGHHQYLGKEHGKIPKQAPSRMLLVTRLMRGDAHHLSLREEELFDMSVAVLRALVVFHQHNYLHMDIKPENILWDIDSNNRRLFCLSDYNLVLSDTHVMQYLRPNDGGGFQSLSHGTEGYKSPLLMTDDFKGSTYTTFALVASKTRAFQKDAMPVWREYFERARLSTSMAKVDLHSLALTLFRLAVPNGQDKKYSLKLMRGPIGKFMAKLMFFRPHDFQTASEALSYLAAHVGLTTKKKRGVSSTRPMAVAVTMAPKMRQNNARVTKSL